MCTGVLGVMCKFDKYPNVKSRLIIFNGASSFEKKTFRQQRVAQLDCLLNILFLLFYMCAVLSIFTHTVKLIGSSLITNYYQD